VDPVQVETVLDVLAGSVRVDAVGDRRVLVLDGEVDAATLDDFRERAGAEPPVVDTIDAGAVTYLSAQGLCLLVTTRAASRAAGRAGRLVTRSPAVDRVVALSGLGAVLGR
jgi:anti-anti-sigma factor